MVSGNLGSSGGSLIFGIELTLFGSLWIRDLIRFLLFEAQEIVSAFIGGMKCSLRLAVARGKRDSNPLGNF